MRTFKPEDLDLKGEHERKIDSQLLDRYGWSPDQW
jgi:hypothetical protein